MTRSRRTLAIVILSVSIVLSPLFLLTASAADINTGIFLPDINYKVGSFPDAVAIGDVNGDGLNDAVMTTYTRDDPANDYKVFVFLQNGQGQLDPPIRYSLDVGRPYAVEIGDVTGDGRNDVVVGINGKEVEVLPQDIQGNLASAIIYPTGNSNKLKISDINNDGLQDLVALGWGTNTVDVMIQKIDGTFAAPCTYAVTHGGWDDLDVGDVNNDGLIDIVVMSGQLWIPNIGVLLQQSDGAFSAPHYYSVASNILSKGVAVGDVNGDGLNDVVLSYGGNKPYSKIGVFLQNGSGTLEPPVSYAAIDIPEPVEIADVDADGRDDVIIAHGGWNRLSVFLQRPDGSLAPYQEYSIPYASHYNPEGLDIGDLNHDGYPDAAIADYNYGLVVLYSACGTKPDLSLTTSKTYWASFGDYVQNILSVDYKVSAPSVTTGNNVTIVGMAATNGVSEVSAAPVSLGIVSPAAYASFTMQYSVPPGVVSFKSVMYATAQDACGNTYEYPGPMPLS